MIPILMMYTGFVGLMGSYLNVAQNEQTTLIAFFQSAFDKITMLDIVSSLVRAIAYGFTIGIVGCYKGYNTTQGTVGVGKAANAAVVASMFLIFIEEVIIVQIVNAIR